MCGITGFVDYRHKSKFECIQAMTDVLNHRGPDDSGYFFESFEKTQIGLGHRRLSILDLTNHGHQPMEFANLQIVYNGEVYNYKEIRTELEKEGYLFESNTDTEVILKAYHKWGNEAVHYFNGMFSIAILDMNKRTLTIMRDRAGVKPLYWYYKDEIFLFASELKSFHKHPEFKKEINPDGLTLFLQYGYIPQPHTIFKNTHKLESGHILEFNINNGEIFIKKYWDVIDYYNKPKLKLSEAEVIKETERLLKSSCEYRMVADVPVGIFLSGGYDSSTVTALLQTERSEKLKTFTIGFHDQNYNEAQYANKIAKILGTEHEEYYCTFKDAIDILPKLPEIWDEPFSDKSVIPTILVSKIAREKVTVSLSADGGDELFGGYDKYVQVDYYYKMLHKIPSNQSTTSVLNYIAPKITILDYFINNFSSKFYRGISFLAADSQTEAMQRYQEIFTKLELSSIVKFKTNEIISSFSDEKLLNSHLSDLDKMMAIDFKTYQLDNILTKVDRATMSVGLEGREPLLDYRLIEFLSQISSNLKINNGNKKYLLKKITHKYIPQEIMNRPKMGFNVPIADWFSYELKHYIDYYLETSKLNKHGLFHVEKINYMKYQYLNGNKHYFNKIWPIIVFQMWYEYWM